MKKQLSIELSFIAVGLALLIATSSANALTMTFDTPGAALDSGLSYSENGMKVTVTNAASTVIGTPLSVAGDNGLYFHGTNATMMFTMIDGSSFNLNSFDFATNATQPRWLSTYKN